MKRLAGVLVFALLSCTLLGQTTRNISGRVFNDSNRDGTYDPSEPGLANWRVDLYYRSSITTSSGAPDFYFLQSTFSGSEGYYSFSIIADGSSLRLYAAADPNWTQSFPATPAYYELSGAYFPPEDNNHFGFTGNPATVRGKVFNDFDCDGTLDVGEPGIAHWPLDVSSGLAGTITGTVDDNGNYIFMSNPGTVTWDVTSPPGWGRTSPHPFTEALSPGQLRESANFGASQTGFIYGYQYDDHDFSNAYDGSDSQMGTGTVSLLKDGIILLNYLPSSDGYFQFSGLPPGSYVLRQTLNSANRAFANPASGEWTVDVRAGVASYIEFGSIEYGTFSGVVFNDLNANLSLDPGEPGLPGITVKIETPTALIGSTITNSNGEYEFNNLYPATYKITEIIPEGWYCSHDWVNYPMFSGITAIINWPNRFIKSNIEGTCFNDVNENGIFDLGETGMADWEIVLKSSSALIKTTTSDASGKYTFSNIDPGTYSVTETMKTGWRLTYPGTPGVHSITVGEGETSIGNDFGNALSRGSIGGKKYHDLNGNALKETDEPGLQGWSIVLKKATGEEVKCNTDVNGDYVFLDLQAGSYELYEESQSGWIQTAPLSPDKYSVNLEWGENLSAYDFGNCKYGSIYGFKFNDLNANGHKDAGEPNLPGWKIKFECTTVFGTDTDSAITDGVGNYAFTDLIPGSYIISEEEKESWKQTAPTGLTYSFNIGSNQNVLNINFGNTYLKGSVQGTCFNDLNENGIQDVGEMSLAGWTVDLINTAGATHSTNTGIDGKYLFADIDAGNYTVRENVKTGWRLVFPPVPGVHNIEVLPGQTISGKNFGNILSPGSICGMIYNDLNGNGTKDLTEPGLPDFPIKLKKATGEEKSTISDNSGGFCFTNIAPGTYNLLEEPKTGWTQTEPVTPSYYVVTYNSGDNLTGYYFGNRIMQGGVNGYKFYDKNANGIFDVEERGIPDWKIMLSLPAAVLDTYTDSSGFFEFRGIPFGNYTLSEDLPEGWQQSLPGSPWNYSVEIKDFDYLSNVNFGNYFVIDTAIAVPSDLIAWWSFDETEGSIANDLSPYSNHGEHKNAPQPEGAVVNYGLKFDGLDDFVRVNHNTILDLESDFSIDGWIRTESTDMQKIIEKTAGWSSNPGYSIYLEDGKLCYRFCNGSLIAADCSDLALNDGYWHHIALSFDRTNGNCIKLFIDGRLVKKSFWNDLAGSCGNNNDLTIGSSSFENSGFFAGVLDELDIYRAVLPDDIIFNIWAADSLGKRKIITEENIDRSYTVNTYRLFQCYPNPFNPSTLIRYQIPDACEVKLIIYDLLGREVQTLISGYQVPGTYDYRFNASILTSGVYIYKLQAGTFSDFKKLILLR